ncbi:hypothetical protein BKA70DRAFT_1314541 [Coprinopsis sp. MPI-PUGE-AT-0042]|nr:hypothetical protein BKA70DRAFT_1314541 [Coprinopsis sp. MPI-PUGE-AT-0042]
MATLSPSLLAQEQSILKITFAAFVTATSFLWYVFYGDHGLYLYFESPIATRARRRLYMVLSVIICLLNSYGMITEMVEMQYVFTELRAPGASLHYMEAAALWWQVLGSCGTGIGFVIYSTRDYHNIGLVSALYTLSAALNAGVTGLIIWKLLLMNLPGLQQPISVYFGTLWAIFASFCPQLIIYRVAHGKSFMSAGYGTESTSLGTLNFYHMSSRRSIHIDLETTATIG